MFACYLILSFAGPVWAGWILRRKNLKGFKKRGWARCPGIVFILFSKNGNILLAVRIRFGSAFCSFE